MLASMVVQMNDLFSRDDESPQRKGGRARAAKLSPEQRSEIARLAAHGRWGGDDALVKATHGSSDRPLIIGDLKIPCYVLEDGRRVLSMSGVLTSLGMSKGSGMPGQQGDRLYRFATSQAIFPYVSNDLIMRMEGAVRFRAPSGGIVASGYEATILPDLCDAILEARRKGALLKRQAHIAEMAEILVRGLARVGIIALVDEATGYQEVRDRKALEEILNKYISEELRKWTPTFPDSYFAGIFKLKNWNLPSFPTARPGVIAYYTKDIVYSRLAPGVLEELQALNPTNGRGRRKYKLFHHLTPDHGHPKLKEHLRDVVLLMDASQTWPEFKRLLDRVKPQVNAPGELPLSPEPEEEP